MSRTIARSLVLVVALVTIPTVIGARATLIVDQQPAAQVSAADAEPFLGDWTLALQGPNGPGAFTLSLKVEKEKVSGELLNEMMGTQPIKDISKADKALLLGYSFNWEGNPVDAVVKLTPASEGKMEAQIDFAGGAYVMTGTATKKEKAK
jgi:hypothetical protein